MNVRKRLNTGLSNDGFFSLNTMNGVKNGYATVLGVLLLYWPKSGGRRSEPRLCFAGLPDTSWSPLLSEVPSNQRNCGA